MIEIELSSVDSTNSYARRWMSEHDVGEELVVVSTREQTHGRGQKGNSWESEYGKNLTFSLLFHPQGILASGQFVLSQAMALSILDMLEWVGKSVVGDDRIPADSFSVKWPNDIYYLDKKISGTLIECDLEGKALSSCIIGSGINVNQREFRSDAPNPVSLWQIYHEEFPLHPLLMKVSERFEYYLQQIYAGDSEIVRKRYMEHLYRRTGYHRYKDRHSMFLAKITGIEASGHLILESSDGEERRYEFKEVAFLH